MKRALLGLLLLTMALALPARAQQKVDFSGQAVAPAPGSLDMYSVVLDADPIPLPLPLDFANHQYTLVFTGFLAGPPTGSTTPYGGGTITLYEDAATPADFANPATFVDGVPVLVSHAAVFTHTVFTPTLGTVDGSFDWTAGSWLPLLHPDDRVGWDISSGTNAMASQVEPGYRAAWDGTVEPRDEVVGTAGQSFGEWKSGGR